MDFFERQDLARRKTKSLVFYFTLAVVFTIAAIYLVLALIFLAEGGLSQRFSNLQNFNVLWDLELFLGVAIGTLAVILSGSLYKSAQLSKGGSAVALMLGGKPLLGNGDSLEEQRLLNVVEEMTIASGTPMPDVYIIEDKSINAFAAGTDPSNAAIGVTRGCIQLLSRDELQGVIAHEFSHILNGDMGLNIRLIGILHGLLCIAVIGRILLHMSAVGHRRHYLNARSSKKGGNPLPLIGLALLIIGCIGVFFGKLIKSAVSRQREFLADASAVQFTRNPGGIGGALKKIGGLVYGSRITSSRAEEASHMFFGNGLKPSWFNWFSTHPPLAERIRVIDPSFTGEFPRVSTKELDEHKPAYSSAAAYRKGFGSYGSQQLAPALEAMVGSPTNRVEPARVSVDDLTTQVGAPKKIHLEFAENLLNSLPQALLDSVREPFGACAVVYLCLLDEDNSLRHRQWTSLEQSANPGVMRELKRLSNISGSVPREGRLALIDLALPALKQLIPVQYHAFRQNVQRIIESDRQIDLFEYTLQKILTHRLDPVFGTKKLSSAKYYALKPLLPDTVILFSGLSYMGTQDEREARLAFLSGIQALGIDDPNISPVPFEQSNLSQMDGALERISHATPGIKKRLIRAMAFVVASDKRVEHKEAELLRAIAETLDCPIPPFVRSAA